MSDEAATKLEGSAPTTEMRETLAWESDVAEYMDDGTVHSGPG